MSEEYKKKSVFTKVKERISGLGITGAKDTVIVPHNFSQRLKEMQKEEGISEQQAVQKLIGDGFMVFIEETVKEGSEGKAELRFIDLFQSPSRYNEKKWTDMGELEKCRWLREYFGPVSAGVDYLRDFTLGSGMTIKIDNPRDTFEKELRDKLKDFIDDVYGVHQDIYTSFQDILEIMVDKALTMGASAAEIIYDIDIKFEDWAKPTEIVLSDGSKKLTYIVSEPEKWEDKELGLGGIRRLKILEGAISTLTLQRNSVSWLPLYWVYDPSATEGKKVLTVADVEKEVKSQGKQKKKNEDELKRFLTWQIFWLAFNRRKYGEKGQSVVKPVIELSHLLEQIQLAVGEGLYRAGNKKYFIICGTEKRPWAEPYIRNVLVRIKEMGQKPWSGIPVPAGFDIKEMGGEIFEGRDIINHLTSMIASGMGVPREVIDMQAGRQTEKPWVVSQVAHKRRQEILIRAIRKQLFARHLWCEYGKEKNKKGGKGTIPLYIPFIRMQRLDYLGEKERLEAIFKSWNVANPLRPATKLETERDFCDIMGYDNTLLESQEELEERMKELEKQLMKQPQKGQVKELGPPRIPAEAKATLKEQGKPKGPPTEEQMKKRQEKGVSTRIQETEALEFNDSEVLASQILAQKDPEAMKWVLEQQKMGNNVTIVDYYRRMMKEGKIDLNINIQQEKSEEDKKLEQEIKKEKLKKLKEEQETEKEKQKTEKKRREAIEKVDDKVKKVR